MKIGNFVQLVVDVQDLLSNFVGVKTTEQMVSALERIRKNGAPGFHETISSLQNTFDNLMADDIETPSADEIDSLFAGSDEDQPRENESAAERLGITNEEIPSDQ